MDTEKQENYGGRSEVTQGQATAPTRTAELGTPKLATNDRGEAKTYYNNDLPVGAATRWVPVALDRPAIHLVLNNLNVIQCREMLSDIFLGIR